MKSAYVPREYWDERLSQHFDLTGVGFGGYSQRYNKWLYRFQELALGKALDKAGAPVRDARVLDVGSGIGYWVNWYYRSGAAALTSVDITPTAVRALKEAYPSATVFEADITDPAFEVEPHDLVNIISVVYHIVDQKLFSQALVNLAKGVRPGGHLVLSDKLGDREVRPAEHVRFRALDTYVKELRPLGLEIVHVQPMHTLMNGGLRGAFAWAPGRVRGLAWRAEEWLAPALYLADQLPGMSAAANSHILVARKHAR